LPFPPSQPRFPFARHSSVEVEGSQIPSWYSPRIPSAGKRKMEEIDLDSEPEGDETVESDGMEVDTDATHEIRTTMSVSPFCFSFVSLCVLTPCQTSVSVTAMEDAQPVAKKTKTEAGKETQVETSTVMNSVDATESKKTRTSTESKSRSEYKNSDLPVPGDHKWTNVFIDTAILWAGGQPNIWSIPDETLATALQEIFSIVYPDVQYQVMVHGAVFGVVHHHPHSFFMSSHFPSLKYK